LDRDLPSLNATPANRARQQWSRPALCVQSSSPRSPVACQGPAHPEHIKTKIEELNKRFAPIRLSFDMFRNNKYDSSEDNWFVTIVYNYTENEWMDFVSLGFYYNQVCEKLFGFAFALEAVLAYQEEYGPLVI
jgi:hypothetical protein